MKLVRPWKSQLCLKLENELRPELNRAWTAGAYGGIGSCDVRRRATPTKRNHGKIIQAKAVLSPVRVGKIRMIENVEELSSELEPHGFSKVEVLGHGEIEILEAGVLGR